MRWRVITPIRHNSPPDFKTDWHSENLALYYDWFLRYAKIFNLPITINIICKNENQEMDIYVWNMRRLVNRLRSRLS